MKNKCQWCNKECDFLSGCEGVCVPCFDKMMAMPQSQLIAGLAKASLAISGIRKAWRVAYREFEDLRQYPEWQDVKSAVDAAAGGES